MVLARFLGEGPDCGDGNAEHFIPLDSEAPHSLDCLRLGAEFEFIYQFNLIHFFFTSFWLHYQREQPVGDSAKEYCKAYFEDGYCNCFFPTEFLD